MHDARVDEKRKPPQAHAVTNFRWRLYCTVLYVRTRMDPIGSLGAGGGLQRFTTPHLLRPAGPQGAHCVAIFLLRDLASFHGRLFLLLLLPSSFSLISALEARIIMACIIRLAHLWRV